jgi:hypothetical protein
MSLHSIQHAVELLQRSPDGFGRSAIALGECRGRVCNCHCCWRNLVETTHDDATNPSGPWNSAQLTGAPNRVKEGEAGPRGKAQGVGITLEEPAPIQLRRREIAIMNPAWPLGIRPAPEVITAQAPREPAAFQDGVLPPEVLQLLLHLKIAANEVRMRDDQIARRDSENQCAVLERQVWPQEIDNAWMKIDPLILKNHVFEINLAQVTLLSVRRRSSGRAAPPCGVHASPCSILYPRESRIGFLLRGQARQLPCWGSIGGA